MPAPLIAGALALGNSLVERLFPDPEQQDKAKLELLRLEKSGELARLSEASGIIQAEANSEHVITATWRPVVMLTLTGCVAAHWFGFTPENLDAAQVDGLLEIVKFGLGGYVVGRSAEKTAKAWKGKN